MLSPVCDTHNILRALIEGNPGNALIRSQTEMIRGGKNQLLKDLLVLQINSYSISKLPTGFSKEKKPNAVF